MSLLEVIASDISQATSIPFQIKDQHGVGGGCISSAYCLRDGERTYFVKTNSADKRDMFEAEFAGLQDMAASQTIKVPQPVCTGSHGGHAYIVMEYLEAGHDKGDAMERFGRELAAMHRTTREQFGWRMDNTIGATPQVNTPQTSWPQFWRDQRLGFQLQLAARNGYGGRLQSQGDKLLDNMDLFFTDHNPPPSLLHGDLWSGNYMIASGGMPVIFDPAVYFGDREADLAMTELFGSFGSRFYAAYGEAWPLDDGYPLRKTLYNLYHIINHVNLFGGGYLSQAESMLNRLLAEII